MDDYRFADEKFTGFVPQNARQAIMKFRRLQATGISPFQYPETFVECAVELDDDELRKFEEWMVCPQGEPGKDCMPVAAFSEDNLRTHEAILRKRTQDDEKAAA